ncbi:MAG: ATP-binding protein [Pseudomonadota bacterium]
MLPTDSPLTPDREATDQNLDRERKNADRALAEQKAAVEAHADHVVERARDKADSILQEARDKADEKLREILPVEVIQSVVNEERKVEDQLVEQERATADQSLALEREQNARDLMALLPFERRQTDRALLTERIRSDDALNNRDDFLGMVSHDLRDLLGGIVTAATVLRRTAVAGEPGDPARVSAERILRHASRMKRLIDDLTDLTGIDAGKLAVTAVPGNLAPVILEAMGSQRGAAAARSVALEPPQLPEMLAAKFDPGRVLQVLQNLLGNAIKFTPAGGSIRVGCEPCDAGWKVSVTDTGPGIAPEHIETVFERFRQGARLDRRGLGLGLYISRCLIEAQHGKIWAESTPGQGTTVSFTLPASGNASPQDPQ